jgi:hypothetical protein
VKCKGGVVRLAVVRLAVEDGAPAHPERMKIGPFFRSFYLRGLYPILTAENYAVLAHDRSRGYRSMGQEFEKQSQFPAVAG